MLEAMASGLPVVATAIGGLREQIENGVTGLLVAPRDVDGLVQALTTVLRNPDLRAKMGAAARRRVERLYRSASMVDAYENLYEGLVQESLRRASRTQGRK